MSRTLVSFPYAGMNPYTNMLYLHARSAGWKILETSQPARVVSHLRRLVPGDVFHVQWNWPLFRNGGTWAEAKEAVDSFCEAVDECMGRGIHLLWTVHNMASHDTEFIELETRFNNFMGSRADVVIQLNDYTETVCRESFTIGNADFVTIPHSSYQGIYPNTVRTDEARAALGVPEDHAVVGFLGQVRPYKGIERLIEVAAQMQESGRQVTVLLAGRPQGGVDREILRLVAQHGLPCVSHFGFVDDQDLQLWFKAADVMVFPYRKVLNSGSAYLSAGFGVPCVLPAEPQFEELFGAEPWVGLFDPEDPSALRPVVEAMLDSAEQRRDDAARFARDHLPWSMSSRFLQVLQMLRPRVGAA